MIGVGLVFKASYYNYWYSIPISFLSFLVSGAWIPDFDSLPEEFLGFRIAPNKKMPAFLDLDSLTWRKEKKKVSSYL